MTRHARGPGDREAIERDVQAIRASRAERAGDPAGSLSARGRVVQVDYRAVPPGDLRIARFNASRDPDGQVFPWLSGYPLVGSTVYHDGRIWTVYKKQRGGDEDRPEARVALHGEGHEGSTTAARGDLRPVTWTQEEESRLWSS